MDQEKFFTGVATVLKDIGWFDTSYYLENYPDVGAYPLGATRHYIDCGVVEKRFPRADSLLPFLRETFTRFVRSGLLPGIDNDDQLLFFRWLLTHSQQFHMLGGCTEAGIKGIVDIYRQTAAFRSIHNVTLPMSLSGRELLVFIICRADHDAVAKMLSESLQIAGANREALVMKVRKSGYFDEPYYLRINPDVAASGADPILHYLDHGAAERRDPSARFSSEFYLANYNDVGGTGVNPLLHFLEHGQAEGRQPLPTLISSTKKTNRTTSPRQHLVQLLGKLISDRSIKAVSLDFFDTLVERNHPDPHMVFTSMAQHAVVVKMALRDFKSMRVEAEQLARAQKNCEVTLLDIYLQFGRISGLSHVDTVNLAQLETATELAALRARPLGLAILEHARQRKLKLAITSDFYMGKNFLCEVMLKLNIRHDDITVFVSAESGQTKHQGELFGRMARVLGVAEKQIMHIGDNPLSDYEMPLSRGMAAGLIPTTYALIIPQSEIDEIALYSSGGQGSTVHSHAIQRFRELTVIPSDKALREAAELGYKILGPVIADFTRFISSIARIQRAGQLVFLARDTRLPFDLMESRDTPGGNDPELSYLLVSRQCMLGTALTRYSAIPEVIRRNYTRFSFSGILRERFLLDTEDIRKLFTQHRWLERAKFAKTPGTYAETVDIFVAYAERVFPATRETTARRSNAYESYLHSIFKKDKAALLVDIGYRGTTQKALSGQFGIDCNAVYFMTWPEIDAVADYGLGVWTYVERDSKLHSILTSRVSLLELFLSDPNSGSLKYFANEKEGVFSENPLTLAQRNYLDTLHRFALAYAQDHFAMTAELPAAHGNETVLQSFAAILTSPPPAFLELFHGARFEDRFGGTSHHLLGPNWD
jgi:FMN phosphatase YigB (HAD superfamily)